MLVNFSNYPQKLWSKELIQAAGEYGEVVDINFPNVDNSLDEGDVAALADVLTEKIMAYKPDAVICQGEFTLLYAVVCRLKAADIKVMKLCLERRTDQITKKPVFDFIKFREY